MKLLYRLTIIFSILFTLISISKDGVSTTDPIRLLVHLLDYLAQDYPATVSNGKIINPFEYQEQVEFSQLTIQTYQEIKKKPPSNEMQIGLNRLNQLILQKADPQRVSLLAKEIQKKMIDFYQLATLPSQQLNLSKGQKLYSENCISCHGVTGKGNGPLANQLNPHPTNFLDEERMQGLSPFQLFNTIRLGVPKTAMTSFEKFSDQEVWNLAFYLISLRSQNPLLLARTHLKASLEAYQKKQFRLAEQESIFAYLEGVEPIELSLKVKNTSLVADLEQKMGDLRSFIKEKMPLNRIRQLTQDLEILIQQAELILAQKNSSPWFIFLMTNSILLREGFEAILVIIAILGVLRASGSHSAAHWVHVGWGTAVLLGLFTWVFSGWLIKMSGATRELMEGITSLLAVIILLYVGLWLHHKTEIGRWTSFIDGKVKAALESKNSWGLSLIAFMAVFREAFETVLFLRSLSLEGGERSNFALLGGVITAVLLVFLLAFALLKLSARIPLKKLFNLSSFVIVTLAVMLIGKGIQSFQETGLVPITTLPISFRIDLLGFYPTLETLLPQGLALILILILWNYRGQSSTKTVKSSA